MGEEWDEHFTIQNKFLDHYDLMKNFMSLRNLGQPRKKEDSSQFFLFPDSALRIRLYECHCYVTSKVISLKF